MPELVRPLTRVRTSFVRGMTEFEAEGRGAPDDESMVGREIREFRATWHTEDGFAEYVDRLLADAEEDAPQPEGVVPSTMLCELEDQRGAKAQVLDRALASFFPRRRRNRACGWVARRRHVALWSGRTRRRRDHA